MLNFLRSILKSKQKPTSSKYQCHESSSKAQAEGDFHIDQCTCADHGMCLDIAPDNVSDIKEGSRIVKKQPSTPQERTAMVKAMEACPLDCIHYSGCDPKILSKLKNSPFIEEESALYKIIEHK